MMELVYFVPTISCALHLFALHAVDFTLSNCKINKDGATFYWTILHFYLLVVPASIWYMLYFKLSPIEKLLSARDHFLDQVMYIFDKLRNTFCKNKLYTSICNKNLVKYVAFLRGE